MVYYSLSFLLTLLYDHAEYFRLDKEYSPDLARQKGLEGQGYAIGRLASNYTYSKFRNRELSPGAVESIVKAAPGNEGLQEVGVKFALNHPDANSLEITNFVRAASDQGNESVNLGSRLVLR